MPLLDIPRLALEEHRFVPVPAKDHDVAFWSGDLNYRIESSVAALEVLHHALCRRFLFLAANDQLNNAREAGDAFQGFHEGETGGSRWSWGSSRVFALEHARPHGRGRSVQDVVFRVRRLKALQAVNVADRRSNGPAPTKVRACRGNGCHDGRCCCCRHCCWVGSSREARPPTPHTLGNRKSSILPC